MFIYYVYAYISKRTGLPYYIGKGKGTRAFNLHKNIPVPKDRTRVVFLENNLSEIGAMALERRLITWYGRRDNDTGILLNRTEGGDGSSGCCPNAKTRSLLSEKRRGSNNPNFGKHHSEETKTKIKEARKDYTHSEETRKKISERNKGRKHSEETKLKIAAAKFNKNRPPMTEEQKLKISESAKKSTNKGRFTGGHILSDETKQKMSIARQGKPSPNKGKKCSPEVREKMRQSRLDYLTRNSSKFTGQ